MVVRTVLIGVAVLGLMTATTVLAESRGEKAVAKMKAETGLKEVEVPDTEKEYLGKTHRGYQVLFHGAAGNVWGRFGARVAMGEIGRETGGILSFLTSSYKQGGDAAGSMLDRLLARAIGQPLSITIILMHKKKDVPRLDVLSKYSTIKPDDPLTKRAKIGWGAGNIYSADEAFAARISENRKLMKRLKKLRNQYIRCDETAVTLLWAGQEKDYSAMIQNHKGYSAMLNAIMDDLADIADAIEAPAEEKKE